MIRADNALQPMQYKHDSGFSSVTKPFFITMVTIRLINDPAAHSNIALLHR